MKIASFANYPDIDSQNPRPSSSMVKLDCKTIDEEKGFTPAATVSGRKAAVGGGTIRRLLTCFFYGAQYYCSWGMFYASYALFFFVCMPAYIILLSAGTIVSVYQFFVPLWNWLIDFIFSNIGDLQVGSVNFSKSLSITYFAVDDVRERPMLVWILYFIGFTCCGAMTAGISHLFYFSCKEMFCYVVEYVRTRRCKPAFKRSDLPEKFAKD